MKKVRIWYRKLRGRWYGEYWLNDKRHAKAFRNKRDAYLWKTYIEHKFNHEDWQGITGVQWEMLTAYYFQHKDAQGIAPSTRIEIIHTLKQFEELVAPLQSDLIRQHHIEQFINLRKKQVANRTVNKDLENLRALYRWASGYGYMHTGLKFEFLPTVKKQFQPPSQKQLQELFHLAKQTPPLYLRMVIALTTGLRRSAIEGIKLSDIDIAESTIKVYESKTREHITKPIGHNTLQQIIKYIELLPPKTIQLFPEHWDGLIRNQWHRARKRAGLPGFTFHNLRNLSISLLADKGESSAVLQRHAGHKDYKTTEGYLGIRDETEKRIVKTLDKLFASTL